MNNVKGFKYGFKMITFAKMFIPKSVLMEKGNVSNRQ